MLSVLSEAHFWTLKDDVRISHSDFGAFRYYDKKISDNTVFQEGKKFYAEKRGQVWVPSNKRPVRLKENLRELEDQLSQQRVVLCQWRDNSLLQLMFSSGLFVNISVNMFTGDPISIKFDKYLLGKLLSDYVADVVLTKSHLICSYNDNQLTLVYFTKPALKRHSPKSMSSLDPRIFTVDLAGPVGRRLERKLACNVSGDMVVTWWLSSPNEVYPWSPVVKDQDRANVLVYGISGSRAELLCHHRSEFDLISVSFNHIHSNVIHSVEQKVSRNGDVTVENCSYHISKGSMQRTSVKSIALPTHVCCHAFSPAQDKLLLGCIDGSIVLYDEGCGVSLVVKAAFIPSLMSWHPDGGAVILANERCQFQLLDAALATLRQQLLSEDVTPSTLLDLSSFFRYQPTLSLLQWNKKPEAFYYTETYAVSDCLLLLLFERGPFAALSFIGGGGLCKDIHGSGGLSFDDLVTQYLWVNQVDRAINLLLTLNWDVHGNVCLSSLHRIVNHLFRQRLTPDREAQLQTALGSFHMPARPLCPATLEEFKAPVRDLTRRFFHHLLRYKHFEKAFRLAIDLMDRDLFMDIHFSAKRAGAPDIAEAAYSKARDINPCSSASGSSFSGSSHSVCSRSSCSQCSETASAESSGEDDQRSGIDGNGTRSRARSHPPLPVLTKSFVQPISESGASLSVLSAPTWKRGDGGINTTSSRDDARVPKGHDDPLRHDRPKVKFCETVTQITLPERLQPLAEEEEGRQPPETCLPASFSSLNLNSGQRLALNIESHSAPRFSHLANAVGIPIDSSICQKFSNSRNRLSEEEGVKNHEKLVQSGMLSLPVNLSGSASGLSNLSNTKLRSHQFSGRHSLPISSFASTPSLSTYKVPSVLKFDLDQHISQIAKDCNLNQNEGQEPNRKEPVDHLGTEELMRLLPGSRKAVASRVTEAHPYKKEIPNTSQADDAYFINYSGALHDLSEEEENNGAIKIVHFGVV